MTQSKPLSKNFFLLSFLPAIAYWYLEANYSIKIAVIGGLTIGLLEISLEYFFLKEIHKISKLNFGLLVILGSLSLLGEDGIWYKLQPMLGGLVLSAIWSFNIYRNKSFMQEMLPQDKLEMLGGKEGILHIEKINLGFIFFNSLFMGYLALFQTTEVWVFFKTIGGYVIFGIFLLAQMLYLRFYLRKIYENRFKAMLVKKF